MKFEKSFASLGTFSCPQWFADAKFGIWSHWGPQSVPMYGDWYARHMYVEGSDQYKYHLRHYGHPSEFGYKDLCALWHAEAFDPDALMEKYYKAGARYFVAQAMHHDHFFNYPSKLNRFNSMLVGPGKDICGMWKKAADKFHLPFGLTEHLGASFSWWCTNKGCDKKGPYAGVPYDGNDPAYRDFYWDNQEHYEEYQRTGQRPVWYSPNAKFRKYWLDCMYELIDLFEPDLLYSDGALPFGSHDAADRDESYREGLAAVSYLYNKSIARHGENRAIYTQKDRDASVYRVGVLDIEKSQLTDIAKEPWQTDTCIGNWFYDVRANFKTPGHIIEMLIDIVAKNGCMLLNILQRPDGSIDREAEYILDELASWYAVCGEAVYGSRPFRVAGEGLAKVVIDGFREDRVPWNENDYRFVTKNGKLYAFMMKAPADRVAVIRSLSEGEHVSAVRLLGGESLPFTQFSGVLNVKLPDRLPTAYTNCLEITVS